MTTDEIAEQELLTHRDTMRSICPPWLQRGLAEKILYALSIQCDAFGDALVAGVMQRFPGLYSFDSLQLLGRERRIPRAPSETDAQYAERLTTFLDAHRHRGGPYALLNQLFIRFKPDNFPIDLVYVAHGRRFAMAVDGTVTRSLTDFVPDGDAAKWARWWLFYYTDQWAVTPPTDDELAELRLIPRHWNAAHPFGYIVLFSTDTELWNWPPDHVWNESGVWNTAGTPNYIEVEPL